MIPPNPKAYIAGGGIDLAVKRVGAVVPNGAVIFNEIGGYLKN
jgi:hypothetical protein